MPTIRFNTIPIHCTENMCVYLEHKNLFFQLTRQKETMMNNLQKLHELGQSAWYDNISRDLLDVGNIGNLVNEGIRGLTSNPAIFKAAISGSAAYDSQL